ncbi:hypothetical protein COP2_003094 [Malus domestica]
MLAASLLGNHSVPTFLLLRLPLLLPAFSTPTSPTSSVHPETHSPALTTRLATKTARSVGRSSFGGHSLWKSTSSMLASFDMSAAWSSGPVKLLSMMIKFLGARSNALLP